MYELVLPSINRFGAGCVASIGELAKENAVTQALIVTDHNLVKLGVIKPVLASLDAEGIGYVLFDEVSPNPTKENVALTGISITLFQLDPNVSNINL